MQLNRDQPQTTKKLDRKFALPMSLYFVSKLEEKTKTRSSGLEYIQAFHLRSLLEVERLASLWVNYTTIGKN